MGAEPAENLATISLIPPFTGVGRVSNVSVSGFQAAAIYGLYRAWLEPDPWQALQLLYDTADQSTSLQARVKYGLFTAKGFGPPVPCPAPGANPVLVTWWASPTALALESVTYRSRPFTLSQPVPLNLDTNERRTQVAVFLKLGSDLTPGSGLTATAIDSAGVTHQLTGTYVQHVPGTDCLHQANVRLEPDIPTGKLKLTLSIGGVVTNPGSIEIAGP
jgi:hypothetical protein